MMGKVWDMKAKEMKAKPAGMSADEFKQFYGFLSRGNNTR